MITGRLFNAQLRVLAVAVAVLSLASCRETVVDLDAGPVDAGAHLDAGQAADDAGTPNDAGQPVNDAGQPDSGQADAGPSCPTGVLCSATPLYTSKIGAWYTLWWMPGNAAGTHWHDWTRYQPQVGYYQSGTGAAFATELEQFVQMKLDFLLLDHTNGIGNDNGNIQANGETTVAALDAAATVKLRQAVAIGAALWIPPTPDLAGQASEANYVWAHHANPATHPSSFLANGSPLLVSYTLPGHADGWSDARFTVGAATGTVSAASATMRSIGLFGWVFDEPTPIDAKVMGVMPGWSTAHLNRPTTPIAREGGNLFQREWLRAIKANPAIIMIASWNDFAEETAIEPATRTVAGAELWADSYGTECPAFYYEQARGYSLLRWGLELGAYVREESNTDVFLVTASGLVYQGAMPHCHPVLFVPDGYLAQFPKL